MSTAASVLSLTTDLPEVEFASGEVVMVEGSRTGSIWILVGGSVEVRLGDQQISTIDRAGTMFGEMSFLLDQPHSATVLAAGPVRMRLALDGGQLFDQHPEFARLAAAELARRLDSLTGYLADVQRQYATEAGVPSPGLSMVSDVLRHLTHQQKETERPVSARDPDPEF